MIEEAAKVDLRGEMGQIVEVVSKGETDLTAETDSTADKASIAETTSTEKISQRKETISKDKRDSGGRTDSTMPILTADLDNAKREAEGILRVVSWSVILSSD